MGLRKTALACVAIVLVTSWTPLAKTSAGPLGDLAWKRSAGVFVADVAVNGAGMTIVAGWRETDGRYGEAWFVEAFDADGVSRWSDTWLPCEACLSHATALTPMRGGSVVVAGLAANPRRNAEGAGWVIRAYDRHGATLWSREQRGWMRGATQSMATGISAWRRGIVISGYHFGDYGEADAWVRSYRLGGGFKWSRDIGIAGRTDLFDAALDVAVDRDGRAFVVGYVRPNAIDMPLEGTDREPFVQAVSPSGRLTWMRVFRRAGDLDSAQANAVAVRRGAIVVGGYLDGFGFIGPFDNYLVREGRPTAWLARLSTYGVVRWTKTWGGARGGEEVRDVALAPSGTIWTVDVARTRDRSLAMTVRRFTPTGASTGRAWSADRASGHLVGTAISLAASGRSAVGSVFEDWWTPSKGRVWRYVEG